MADRKREFRFDENNELHRKAQHYIKTMDREKFPSFGDVMVQAIVDFFDRYYAEEHNIIDEAQWQKEELRRIVGETVEEVLDRRLSEWVITRQSAGSDQFNVIGTAESLSGEEASEEPVPVETVEAIGTSIHGKEESRKQAEFSETSKQPAASAAQVQADLPGSRESKEEPKDKPEPIDLSEVEDEINWGFLGDF